MRFLSYLTTFLVVMLLGACGGGGGSSGSNPNQPTVFTTAPAQLLLPIGAIGQYEIRGGVAPYTVNTSNSRVVTVSISGTTFIVNPVGQGTATISVRDNNNGSASIAVTVGDPLKLSMETIKSYVGDKINVLITGGTPPYRATSLDLAIGATVNGNNLLLDLRAISKVDVVVIDALNQQAKVNVEVVAGSPQFNLVPIAQSIAENSTQPIFLNVVGGVAPLRVQSSDTTLLQASIQGNVVTVTTGTNLQRCVPADAPPVTITVIDARGGFATSLITLVRNPAGCGLRVSANPVTMIEGQTVKVTLEGTSDTGVISLLSSSPQKVTATYSAGIITLTGVATTIVPATTEVRGIPTGCGPAPAPVCTTQPAAAVPEHDEPVTITVVDSGPPARSIPFNVSVLKKAP
ncbi:hypothetical protein [Polaromonas sp.]|uniref:hypothetical protein n=1 Tax=Polaromonas sp. TaxID=1869339 RepID=UPI00183E3956|nr:hypothetical protein [Polaromonas sp.]NML84184.1 hypothetical protein [Polaromonas sp.]